MTSRSLAEHTFSEILAEVASACPSPGGGAVGALIVCLGIACGLKAINISLKRKADSDQLGATASELQRISSTVLGLADTDGAAFEHLLAAYKLPRTTIAENQFRREEIYRSAENAAKIGRAINDCARRATVALDSVKDEINANIASDYSAAYSLLRANLVIQQENIDTNAAIAEKFADNRAV